jgi:hypothetical protein
MRNRLTGALLALCVAVTVPVLARPAAAEQPPPTGSSFTVAEPSVRVLDTRNGIGMPAATVAARTTVTLNLAPHVAVDTTAVVLNLTAVSPTQPTYVTMWQAGTPRPAVSNLNLRAREIRANSVTVPVGADKKVNLYNHSGNVHLLADLVGRYSSGADTWFNPVTPQRVLDTKATGEPFYDQYGRTVDLAGQVPPETTAVVLNVTAVQPTKHTYLSVFPDIFHPPNTSSLNVARGETTPNLVTVAVHRPDLSVAVWNNSGNTHVLIDLVGYYSPAEGDAFHPVTAQRAYDSRATQWLPPNTKRRVPLGGAVPAEARTALFNLTGLANYYGTYLTAFQAGQPRPGTSNLNLMDLQVASNQAVVPLGVQRAVDVYNHFGYTNIIVDVFGYFAPRG